MADNNEKVSQFFVITHHTYILGPLQEQRC